MAAVLQIKSLEKWKESCFKFLISSALKDFRINLKSCHLKKWEKKQLIGRLRLKSKVLE